MVRTIQVRVGSRTPVANQMIFGMFNANSLPGSGLPDGQNAGAGFSNSGETARNFDEIRTQYMDETRIKVRRDFNTGIPSSDNTGSAARGIVNCYSVKGTMSTAATGGYNSNFVTLANAFPSGTWFIFHHEPEDDVAKGLFTATQWVSAQQHFYDSIKGANSTHIVGASHMCYQWGSSMSSTANPTLWEVPAGHQDFVGGDAYLMEFQANQNYSSAFDEPRISRWHDWAMTRPAIKGFTELGFVQKYETGVDPNPLPAGQEDYQDVVWSFTTPFNDTKKASLITNTIDDAYASDYKFILFWNAWHADFQGSGTAGSPYSFRDHNLNPTDSDTTSYPLALAAWNNKVAQYGSTSTNLLSL